LQQIFPTSEIDFQIQRGETGLAASTVTPGRTAPEASFNRVSDPPAELRQTLLLSHDTVKQPLGQFVSINLDTA